MQGKILDYNSDIKSGLIRGKDGNKYQFSIDDCKSSVKPHIGADVDFEPSRDRAEELYVLNTDLTTDIKDSAVNTAKTAIETSKKASKKIFPVILFLAIVTSIGVFVFGYLIPENEKKQEEAMEQKIVSEFTQLVSAGDKSYKSKDYQAAINSYEQALEKLNAIPKTSIIGVNYSIIKSYIGMNDFVTAEEKMNVVEKEFYQANENLYIDTSLTHNAKLEATRAKIWYLIHKHKGNKEKADEYANKACENGDCSLR